MITRTDDFNRASLGSDWAQRENSVDLYNSVNVLANSTNNEVRMDWVRDTCHADQRAQIVVAQIYSGNFNHYIGASLRGASGAKTYYGFQCDRISQYVYSYINGGTPTVQLNGGTGGVVANDVLKVELVGIALKAWVNAGNVLDTTDSGIASGQVGVTGYTDGTGPITGSDSTRGDNWEASWEGSDSVATFTLRNNRGIRPYLFGPGNAK